MFLYKYAEYYLESRQRTLTLEHLMNYVITHNIPFSIFGKFLDSCDFEIITKNMITKMGNQPIGYKKLYK